MKILVFSDSHGNSMAIDRAIAAHNAKADLVIFLGDGLNDIELMEEKYPQITFFKVKGNCDFMRSDIMSESILNLDGVKILICHGHKYNVKGALDTLVYAGMEKEVDAVLFGHTHVPYDSCQYINDKRIQIFNPGSIGMKGTYGVLNISGGVLVTGLAQIERVW